MVFLSNARFAFMALFVFGLAMMPCVVFADDEPTKEELEMSVKERVEAFTADLDQASERHFYAVYGSYNVIQVVEGVREQISNAVDKCGDENPDMEDALDARYESWDESIEGVIDEADANVDNMIIAQDYAKPRALRKVLKFADKKRLEQEEQAKKFPVTTQEACQYLLEKMDETQESLSGLLRSTLVSLPNSLVNAPNDEDAKNDKAE